MKYQNSRKLIIDDLTKYFSLDQATNYTDRLITIVDTKLPETIPNTFGLSIKTLVDRNICTSMYHGAYNSYLDYFINNVQDSTLDINFELADFRLTVLHFLNLTESEILTFLQLDNASTTLLTIILYQSISNSFILNNLEKFIILHDIPTYPFFSLLSPNLILCDILERKRRAGMNISKNVINTFKFTTAMEIATNVKE